jgi:lipoate---protein ligase
VTGWTVEVRRGVAGELHALEMPEPAVPTMWIFEADRPALVLGSTQSTGVADAVALEHAGVELVQRRSGGGAVLVVPGCTWVDLILPVGHPLWQSDVGRATRWVGDLWVGALGALGVWSVAHHGPMQRSALSKLACFAGVGPGEVFDLAGAKLVGVSQRRTRGASRFQTVAYHDPADIAALTTMLDLDDQTDVALRSWLVTHAAAVPVGHDELIDRLVASLPTA